ISSIERLLVTPTSEELKKIQKELDISFVENSNEKYFAEPDLIEQAAFPDSDGSISAVEKENAYVYEFNEVDNASVGQKRKAKKEKQIPEAKRSFSKIARVGVWVLVLGLGASGGMAFGAAATANVRSAQAQAAVESVQNQLSNPEEIVDDTTQVDAYFSRFLPIFLNSNPQDNAAKTVREETLKEYFGDPSVVSSSSSYIQKLTSYKLYEISQEDTQRVAKYLVTYSIEDTEEDSTELVVNQLINIPFISENGVIAISEIPYYTSAPQDKGLTGLQENSMNDESEVPSDESSEVTTFLEQFFSNYATNSLEDMSYMMADPESLDGEYEYVSSDNRVYAGQDGGYIVKSVVEFTLKDTTFNHKENMTITLSKVDGKFFVSELNHTLGGN
ncbi:conjugal transfer protein, partial [Enterococcus sp. LJL90]